MKFINGIVLTKINDKNVAICTGEATNVFCGFINLNDTAYEIWQYIEKDYCIEQIAKELSNNYLDLDFSNALKYTNDFINDLKQKGILLD